MIRWWPEKYEEFDDPFKIEKLLDEIRYYLRHHDLEWLDESKIKETTNLADRYVAFYNNSSYDSEDGKSWEVADSEAIIHKYLGDKMYDMDVDEAVDALPTDGKLELFDYLNKLEESEDSIDGLSVEFIARAFRDMLKEEDIKRSSSTPVKSSNFKVYIDKEDGDVSIEGQAIFEDSDIKPNTCFANFNVHSGDWEWETRQAGNYGYLSGDKGNGWGNFIESMLDEGFIPQTAPYKKYLKFDFSYNGKYKEAAKNRLDQYKDDIEEYFKVDLVSRVHPIAGPYLHGSVYSDRAHYLFHADDRDGKIRLQVSEAHPYDDADYYWALCRDFVNQKNKWSFILAQKIVRTEVVSGIREVLAILKELNAKVSSRMMYDSVEKTDSKLKEYKKKKGYDLDLFDDLVASVSEMIRDFDVSDEDALDRIQYKIYEDHGDAELADDVIAAARKVAGKDPEIPEKLKDKKIAFKIKAVDENDDNALLKLANKYNISRITFREIDPETHELYKGKVTCYLAPTDKAAEEFFAGVGDIPLERQPYYLDFDWDNIYNVRVDRPRGINRYKVTESRRRKAYDYETFDDLVNYYEQNDILSLKEIWDEIVAQYDDEDLADDVVAQLKEDSPWKYQEARKNIRNRLLEKR